MEDYRERIKQSILKDIKENAKKGDMDKLYLLHVANQWMDININGYNTEEMEIKLEAFKRILFNGTYIEAVEKSVLANNKEGEYNEIIAKETANLIKSIRENNEYIENSKMCGYKILNKYENPETYKDTSLKVQRDTMVALQSYLKEKYLEYSIERREELKEEKKNKQMER